MYRLMVVFAALPLFFSPPTQALVINSAGVAVVEDFSSFSGAGFSPTPAAGQLDSDDWRITGLSDGDGVFGGTYNSGDFARGTSSAGVSTGGIRNFDVDSSVGVNSTLGVQSTTSDFNTGTMTLRVLNNTASTLSSLLLGYDVYVFNDQARSSFFNFSYSFDDIVYTDILAANLISSAAADDLSMWMQNSRSITLDGLNILDASFFYLRWSSGDVVGAGSGSRDQFALDNISVTGFSELPPVNVLEPESWMLMAIGLAMLAWKRRERSLSY